MIRHVELISASFLGRRRLHINPRESRANSIPRSPRRFHESTGCSWICHHFRFPSDEDVAAMYFHANKPHCIPCNFPVATNWSKPFPVPPDSTKQTGLCPFPPRSKLWTAAPFVRSFAICVYLRKRKRGRGCPSPTQGHRNSYTTIRHRIDLSMFLLTVESIKILNLVKRKECVPCMVYG